MIGAKVSDPDSKKGLKKEIVRRFIEDAARHGLPTDPRSPEFKQWMASGAAGKFLDESYARMKAITDYPDSETRHRLRAWKLSLALNLGKAEWWNKTMSIASEVGPLIFKKGLGRQRAYDRLVRFFARGGITLQAQRIVGPAPLIVWSVLVPSYLSPSDDGQNCVAVEYLLAGRISRQFCGMASGLWTLEVSDHACGRLLERAGVNCDPDAVLMVAHNRMLKLDADRVRAALEQAGQFLVRAGGGVFIVETREKVHNNAGAHGFFAKTWLNDGLLRDDQIPLPEGQPGNRLGDEWLLPFTLQHYRDKGEDVSAMPEMVALPPV